MIETSSSGLSSGPEEMPRHRFPVEALDRLFWPGPGDPMRLGFLFEIIWDRPPSMHLLPGALQRLVARYPILTCRLVPRWGRPAWEGPHGDPVTRVLATGSLPTGAAGDSSSGRELRDAIMDEPLDVAEGDLWKITQAVPPSGRTSWFVHVHHSVGDAHGWLQALDGLLEEIADPDTARSIDRSPRDLIPFLAGAGRPVRSARMRRRVASPWASSSGSQRQHHLFSLEPDIARRVRDRARAAGHTLTDVIHGAVARAIENLGGPIFRGRARDWIRLLMVVDCRSLTPTPVGLANFSRLAPLEIPCPLPRDWASLLSGLQQRKADALRSPMMTRAWPLRVIRSLPLPLFAAADRYALQRPLPLSVAVTNFGPLDPWLPHAGALSISDVQPVGFIVPAMPLVVAASSFRERMTISAGFIKDALPGGRLEEMAHHIQLEVKQFAGV